ncbi:MAG: hypothetical protein QXY40_08240 [Candidatus Methanomethylicia archaeon]
MSENIATGNIMISKQFINEVLKYCDGKPILLIDNALQLPLKNLNYHYWKHLLVNL